MAPFQTRSQKVDIRNRLSSLQNELEPLMNKRTGSAASVAEFIQKKVRGGNLSIEEMDALKNLADSDVQSIFETGDKKLSEGTGRIRISGIVDGEQDLSANRKSFEDSLGIKDKVRIGETVEKNKFLESRLSNPFLSKGQITGENQAKSDSLIADVFKLKEQENSLTKQLETTDSPNIRNSLQQVTVKRKNLQDSLVASGITDESAFAEPEPGVLDNIGSFISGLFGGKEQSNDSKQPDRVEPEQQITPDEDTSFLAQFNKVTNKAAERQRLADEQELRNQQGLAELQKTKPKKEEESSLDESVASIESQMSSMLKMGVSPERVVAERDSGYRQLAIKILVQEGKTISEQAINRLSKVLAIQETEEV